VQWRWELKSVNGRGLDVRLRLPPGMDRLDQRVRERLSQQLQRGSVSVQLEVSRTVAKPPLQINAEAIARVLALHEALGPRVDRAPPRLEALLQVRGVLDTGEEAPEAEETVVARDGLLLAGLDAALTQLVAARRQEGARLTTVIADQITRIADLVGQAGTLAATQPAQLHARLTQALADLLATPQPGQRTIDPQRLEAEVALLALKADVREELDRLTAHIAQARDLLAGGGAIGRKLDFLAQEFNREANTLTSKSADMALTRVGIEIKAIVDQFREQVQNIE
jgi:uncharacterized protein (TIGR00255 family)